MSNWVFQHSHASFRPCGSLQFGGSDVEILASPIGADLLITVYKAGVEVFRTNVPRIMTGLPPVIEHQPQQYAYLR